MFLVLIKGLLVGLAAAIPIGPVGLLCLERTVSYGWRAGVTSTLSMNLADILTAFLVLLFMTIISDFTTNYAWLVSLITGSVFAFIGFMLIMNSKKPLKPITPAQLAASGISTFLLSLSPATVAIMILLFLRLELTTQEGLGLGLTLLGVFVGSVIWSSVILIGGHQLGKHLKDNLPMFKRIAGCIFIAIGIYSAVSQFL